MATKGDGKRHGGPIPKALEWPARMPIRTYNRDFDVPRSKARLGLFEHGLEQRPFMFRYVAGVSYYSSGNGAHTK